MNKSMLRSSADKEEVAADVMAVINHAALVGNEMAVIDQEVTQQNL